MTTNRQTIPYSFEGIVRTGQRQITLAYGYETDPLFIADTGAHTAPAGTCFYQFRAVGGNAGITAILDMASNAVAGWAGSTITPTDFPYNFRCSSIQLSSGKIIAYLKNIQDL